MTLLEIVTQLVEVTRAVATERIDHSCGCCSSEQCRACGDSIGRCDCFDEIEKGLADMLSATKAREG